MFSYAHSQVQNQGFVAEATNWLRSHIESTIKLKGNCVVGLSGGSTPGPIYEQLGKEQLDWTRVFLFLVDERYISAAEKTSNQNLVKSTLLLHPSLPAENLVFPNASLSLQDCISDYSARLSALFSSKGGPDIVTLGLGPDGHIASLFPPLTEALLSSKAAVVHTTTDTFDVKDRITVGFSVLRDAKHSIFLLKGKEKLKAWCDMLADSENTLRWPAVQVLRGGKATLMIGL